MTWYTSGNHMVPDAEPKDKKDECECGGRWEEISWCEDFGDECIKDDCNSYNPKFDCPNRCPRERCSHCEGLRKE